MNCRSILIDTLSRLSALDPASVDALTSVAIERLRQVEDESWTPEHDDAHARGELAQAGAVYLRIAASENYVVRTDYLVDREEQPAGWPWHAKAFKPKNRRSDVVRGTALGLAELARLIRALQREGIAP